MNSSFSLFFYLTMFSLISMAQGQENSTIENSKYTTTLIGSTWYAKGFDDWKGDTLKFISEKEVNYFMSEISWEFQSKYEVKNDTIIVKTILAEFEVEDISGYSPSLIQKYILKNDSLILKYVANFNFNSNEWIEADKERIIMTNNYKRIK